MYQSHHIICQKLSKLKSPKYLDNYHNSFKRIILVLQYLWAFSSEQQAIRKAYFLELSQLKMLTTDSPIWKFLILDHNCNKSLHDDILTKDNKIIIIHNLRKPANSVAKYIKIHYLCQLKKQFKCNSWFNIGMSALVDQSCDCAARNKNYFILYS